MSPKGGNELQVWATKKQAVPTHAGSQDQEEIVFSDKHSLSDYIIGK
jgi:hypothetical protein